MFTLLLQELNWKFAHQAMESLIKPNEENTERKEKKQDLKCAILVLILQWHFSLWLSQNNKNPPLESANLNIGSFQAYFAFSAWLDFLSISERACRGFFHCHSYLTHMKKLFICCCYSVTGEGAYLLTAAIISPSQKLTRICLCMNMKRGEPSHLVKMKQKKRFSKMMLHLLIRMLYYKWDLNLKEISYCCKL